MSSICSLISVYIPLYGEILTLILKIRIFRIKKLVGKKLGGPSTFFKESGTYFLGRPIFSWGDLDPGGHHALFLLNEQGGKGGQKLTYLSELTF